MKEFMHYKSSTYKEGDCCGDCSCDLDYLSTEDKPCWGNVAVVDEIDLGDGEGYRWIHACEGHWDEYLGGGYLKESSEA